VHQLPGGPGTPRSLTGNSWLVRALTGLLDGTQVYVLVVIQHSTLDRTLIWHQAHLRRILRQYENHHN
jgi:hypothetical protein